MSFDTGGPSPWSSNKKNNKNPFDSSYDTKKSHDTSAFNTDSNFITYKQGKNPFDTKFWTIASKRKAEANKLKVKNRLKREELEKQKEAKIVSEIETNRLELKKLKEHFEKNKKNEKSQNEQEKKQKLVNKKQDISTLKKEYISKSLIKTQEEAREPLIKVHREKYDNYFLNEKKVEDKAYKEWKEWNNEIYKLLKTKTKEEVLSIINKKNEPLPRKEDFIKYEKKFEAFSVWKKILSVLEKAVKQRDNLWAKNCSDFVNKAYKIANKGKWIYN